VSATEATTPAAKPNFIAPALVGGIIGSLLTLAILFFAAPSLLSVATLATSTPTFLAARAASVSPRASSLPSRNPVVSTVPMGSECSTADHP